MNLEIAKTRINEVAKADSITTSKYDFLATHITMNRLQTLDRFEIQPGKGKYFTENDLFEQYVCNPNNLHQLVVIYGQSGTGKSHLIRWFNAMLETKKNDNEAVLFVRRSDNTLKGTIKQLLNMPEVQNIKDKDIYDRLLNASIEMPEKELKSTIYHAFITLIDNDDEGKHSEVLSNIKRKRLAEYFRSSLVENFLTQEFGPIDRIYSKIAENSVVDRDTVAEFKVEDFLDEDFNEQIHDADVNRQVKRLINEFESDQGEEYAKEYVDYLNLFIPEVVQRCSGIQPGDFGEIFKQIRQELFRQNKNLTLFIEDITSFTGIDGSLLNCLIKNHTEGEENLCRLSSFVGSTSSYVDSHFLQNHKDRVTKYIYISDDAFDKKRLYEFFGKYLNVMSQERDVFKQWVDGGAESFQYPVYENEKENYWDHIVLDSGQTLSLYPFTKNAIVNLYNGILQTGKRIPRYILRDIIEPIIQELLSDRDAFPTKRFDVLNLDTQLNMLVTQKINNIDLQNRVICFIKTWGDGSKKCYEKNDGLYISGIHEKAFDEFGIPKIMFEETKIEFESETETELIDETDTTIIVEKSSKNDENQEKLRRVSEILNKWLNGEKINIPTTVGAEKFITEARDSMSSYLFSAINWEENDVPYDNVAKVNNKTNKLITLENTRKNTQGLYVLPANAESVNVLMAFCKKMIYSKASWDYTDAYIDSYVITQWTEKYKYEIIKSVKFIEGKDSSSYIGPAICVELYRQVLNGEYQDKTFKNLNVAMYKNVASNNLRNSHVKEWNDLLESMASKGQHQAIKDTIQQFFNVRQGTTRAKNFVVNTKKLDKTLKHLRSCDFNIEEDEILINDTIKERKSIYEIYIDTKRKSEIVAKNEKEKAIQYVNMIYDAFEDDDIDENDIEDFIASVDQLYSTMNDLHINIPFVDVRNLKRNSKKIANGIQLIQDAVKEKNILKQLMIFSQDPINMIEPLIQLINNLDKVVARFEEKIEKKELELKINDSEINNENYTAILDRLDQSEKQWEEI